MYRPQFIDIEWPQSIARLQEEQLQNSASDFCGFQSGHEPHRLNNYIYKTAEFLKKINLQKVRITFSGAHERLDVSAAFSLY
jgi:hypothetical protein